jgi:hypothetical protein
MKIAAALLESSKSSLAWLGHRGDLGMPKFLPELPKAYSDQLEAIVERRAAAFAAAAQRRNQKTEPKSRGGKR